MTQHVAEIGNLAPRYFWSILPLEFLRYVAGGFAGNFQEPFLGGSYSYIAVHLIKCAAVKKGANIADRLSNAGEPVLSASCHQKT